MTTQTIERIDPVGWAYRAAIPASSSLWWDSMQRFLLVTVAHFVNDSELMTATVRVRDLASMCQLSPNATRIALDRLEGLGHIKLLDVEETRERRRTYELGVAA